MKHIKSSFAELIATFTLCFVGAGAIIMDSHTGGAVGLTGIALAHGLALGVGISATMNISGGQVNPAVTIGLMLIGKESVGRGIQFIIFQLLGATIAGFFLKTLFPADAVQAALVGTPALAEGVSQGAGIAIEAIATFLLVFAIYGTAVSSKAPKGLGGLAIGLTLTFMIYAMGPLTGAALNPARHFGTALFAGEMGMNWLYWLGPVLGAAIGFFTFAFILEDEK